MPCQASAGGFLHTLTGSLLGSTALHSYCSNSDARAVSPQQSCRLHSFTPVFSWFQGSLLQCAIGPGQFLSLSAISTSCWVFTECSLICHCLMFPHHKPRVAATTWARIQQKGHTSLTSYLSKNRAN